MLARILVRFIRKIKADTTYSIDPSMSAMSLLTELQFRAVCLIRAQFVLFRVSGSRLRFCESGVKIRHKRYLRLGRGCVIERGADLKCLSRNGFKLGRNVTIGKYCVLECSGVLHKLGAGVRFGDNSSLGDYGFIGAAGGVSVGRNVLVGQRVSFHAQNHRYGALLEPIREQGTTECGIEIGDDCWLGSGSIILDGVVLGSGCVVAAGSVVTKSFQSNSVIAGVPARVISVRGDREPLETFTYDSNESS